MLVTALLQSIEWLCEDARAQMAGFGIMEYLASRQRSCWRCPERWHWLCSCPGHSQVALAAPDGARGPGLWGPHCPGSRGEAAPAARAGTEEMQESRVWALQPPGAAHSSPRDVSRGDRTSMVGKHQVICKILGNIFIPGFTWTVSWKTQAQI